MPPSAGCRPAAARSSAGRAPRPGHARSASGRIAALVVDVHQDRGRQPEVAQRDLDRRVPLAPGQHPHRRRACEPASQVPAARAQQLVARGRDPGEVGHRRAGDEADAAAGRQAEQVEEPGGRDLLDGGRGRGDLAQDRVLVPRADQPVGSERRRLGAADHEPEEAARRHRHQSRVARGRQQVHHVLRGRRPLGQCPSQGRAHRVGVGPRGHRAVLQAVEPGERMLVGAGERESEQGIRSTSHSWGESWPSGGR